jgi:hypothetical protein
VLRSKAITSLLYGGTEGEGVLPAITGAARPPLSAPRLQPAADPHATALHAQNKITSHGS